MTALALRRTSERGFALTYMALLITVLLLFSGLAVDTGRAYVVKAQLTKAVDGAALGAARNLNSGDPRGEAERIFRANFPPGYMGTLDVTDPTDNDEFFDLETDTTTGVNRVTVTASAVLPTTFMRLANFQEVTVSSSGEATRRMVDLSLILDVSSSIGSKWPAVRDAARVFIGGFDGASDRLSLTTFGNGASVLRQMPAGRGFDKNGLISAVPENLPGGSTNMVEGLYRGWDELRTVPTGQQSGLRVIVLFTDGASNGVPGIYPYPPAAPTPASLVTSKTLRTFDFPKNHPDPDNQTWDSPQIVGLFHSGSGSQNPSHNATVGWNSTTTIVQIPYLPENSYHQHYRSSGIPTSFPLQSNDLTVNGYAQSSVRGLRDFHPGVGKYPAQVFNINNAARNLVEAIAHAARDDEDGDYPIRIFTIGMGELVRYNLGTMPEKPEDILLRMANDMRSPDFNDDQLEGRYYFALTGADVGPAFQALQSQIVRLSK
jgi:Flp pilus assembly protein TadG